MEYNGYEIKTSGTRKMYGRAVKGTATRLSIEVVKPVDKQSELVLKRFPFLNNNHISKAAAIARARDYIDRLKPLK